MTRRPARTIAPPDYPTLYDWDRAQRAAAARIAPPEPEPEPEPMTQYDADRVPARGARRP